MKKISKKQKLIILISIITVIVVIGIIIGANVIKVNILTGKYNTANKDSNNGNLLPEYIKAGITLGGVTGTLEDLDTSDATATPEDILYGKTAYVDGKKITGTYMTLGMLQVGDYVDYSPDTTDTSYPLSSTYSGYTSNQTINKENLSWRVLSINDDGTVDLVSSAPTSQDIYFQGALGYNNGVYLLNNISDKLYSNSSLGVTARSLNIEDIEKHMTEEGLKYVHSYSDIVRWGETKTYTGSSSYYPDIYAEENGSGINTTEVKTDGIEPSDSYYTSPTTGEVYSQADSNGLTVKQTYYGMSMLSNYYDNSTFYNLIHDAGTYWLASRYVYIRTDGVIFGLRYLDLSYFYGYYLFSSNIINVIHYNRLRPVVSLKSNIKLVGGNGEEGTPYQIAGL